MLQAVMFYGGNFTDWFLKTLNECKAALHLNKLILDFTYVHTLDMSVECSRLVKILHTPAYLPCLPVIVIIDSCQFFTLGSHLSKNTMYRYIQKFTATIKGHCF